MEVLIFIHLIFSLKGWYKDNRVRILANAKKPNEKIDMMDTINQQANEIKDLKEELKIIKDQMKVKEK